MAALEQLVLDTLALNDASTYRLQGLEIPPPSKKPEWITGGDSDGAVLGRDPLHENRVVTARVRILPQATMDAALAAIAAIGDKLEEAERNLTGVALVWTPAGSTKSFTLRVLSGEITELPIALDGTDAGWFFTRPAPVITIVMTCDPYARGTEVTGTPASSTLPLMTVELTSVTGDVPAEGRLIVTDAATQSRRHVEWGLESRFYPTSSPPGLILDSDSLVTSGFAGTGTTRTGAYDPGAAGNSVIRATLGQQPIAVCGTGDQSHVGTFRVKARVYVVSPLPQNVNVRFAWQEGDGPLRANPYTQPVVTNGFSELDLGIITIPEKALGTQRWTGRVEASCLLFGDTIDVDYLLLIPAAEGWGKVRADMIFQPGVGVAHDEFTGTTAAAALNTRVAPQGGTWATSGVATDFTFLDGPDTGAETITRATSSEATPRFAILGATNYTDTLVEVFRRRASGIGATGAVDTSVIARWTDSSNYARLRMQVQGPGPNSISLDTILAGTLTTWKSQTVGELPDTWYALRLIIYASGAMIGQLLDGTRSIITQIQTSATVLATGGTLATGKPGLSDMNSTTTAISRYYDWFFAATPVAEPISLYSTQSLEVRSDSALREDSTGTFWGPPPGYRGSRFYVPPAGTRSRKARIAVKARRNDVEVAADDQIADNLTVQINYTPRYVNVPR